MKRWFSKTAFSLACITLVAFGLRMYKVNTIPPSLSWDEVSIGYNAYSIWKTGRDEHGRFLPLDTFIAFGDYKPPTAIYATVLPVAIWGLNEFSVRFPSVFFGTLTVLITYGLVIELFFNQPFRRRLGLLTAGILAISPWHIQLSRAGFEANIATFFTVLGIWMILKTRRRPVLLTTCWIPFVITIYTFNSARYVVPLLGIGIVFVHWRLFWVNKWKSVFGVILAICLLIPITSHLLSPQARLRFQEVNIFTDPAVVNVANDRVSFDGNTWWAKVFHNRRIGYARSYLNHFFDHFEPGFLFVHGDGNPKFSIQDVGELYLIELPFFLLGIFWMLVRFQKKAFFLLFWLTVAVVPAAVARETPHALRIETSLPTWHIFIAFGVIAFIGYLKHYARLVLGVLIIFLYGGSFLYYAHAYYRHYAKEFSGEWQYGYREAIQWTHERKDTYERIVVTEHIGRPYAYVLFYERFNPYSYWKTIDASFDAAGFYHVYGFDSYRFVRELNEELKPKTLYIFPPEEVPQGVHVLQTVKRLNGSVALVIFEKS